MKNMKNNYQLRITNYKLLIYYVIFLVVFALIGCQSEVQVKQYESTAKGDITAIPTGQPQEINYTDTRQPNSNETKVTFKISYDIWRIKSPQPPLSKGEMKSEDLKTQALPTTTITKIDVTITGLGISNPQSPIPNPIDISATPGVFNVNLNLNVPIGKRRIITVKGLTSTDTPVPGAELKAVFDVPTAGVVNVNWNTTPTTGIYQELLTKNTTRSKLIIEAININDMENFINTIPVAHKSLINSQKVADAIITLNETEPLTGNLGQLPTDGATNPDYKINTATATINLKDKSNNPLSGAQVLITDQVSTFTTSALDGKATINNIPAGTWKGQVKLSGNVVKESDIIVNPDLTVNLGTLARDNILDWWHNDWNYKKDITLTNSGGNLTDYQTLITLDTATLISAGKMKADGGDIRFIDNDNQTQLNYWIETGINTANTKVWVKVPSIPTGNKMIYMYYGNPLSASPGSAANTFIRVIDGGQPLKLSLPMDENSGTTAYDKSGNGNNGTLTNGPTWVDGKFGKSVSFDGVDDYMTNPVAKPSLPFTMGFWIKPNVNNPVGIFDSAPGIGYVLRNFPEGYVEWHPGSNPSVLLNLTAGNWYHLVFIFRQTSVSVIDYYKNGQLVISAQGATLKDFAWTTLRFGDINFGGSGRFNGTIDEVSIYNRALTAEEISDLYSNYGYTTLNYPGKVLVRKYTSLEPTTNVGAEMAK